MSLFARCLLLFALLAQVLAASHHARNPINAHSNALHRRDPVSKADVPALRPRGSSCRSRSTKPSLTSSSSSTSQTVPSSSSNSGSFVSSGSRLEKIQSLYAFSGFVYALNSCPSSSALTSDFKKMVAKGARTVITFDYCGQGTDASYYEKVISAADSAGINIIPLIWTLRNAGESFSGTVQPRIDAVKTAVINNSGAVLAVALGDEPLYDNDFGSPANMAKYINSLKSDFSAAGLDIPVSISDMAYGWKQAGDISSVASAVDFFMINSFPYFAASATTGGSSGAWSSFKSDISYFEGISKGKPLLVTQTGWPTTRAIFAPNSPSISVSVSSSQGYWDLLDSHCSDFFKSKNIGWMWRSWDDSISGWGVTTSGGAGKWDFSAKTSC